MGATDHNVQGPPPLIVNQENAPQVCLQSAEGLITALGCQLH